MYDHRYDDSPPVYSPPYSAASPSFYPAPSVHSPRPQYAQYSYGAPPDSPQSVQHFHRWFSPPGLVKTFHAATALMCFIIFACVASTLVWDVNGYAYGAVGADSGYYGYAGSYMTPQSAKAAMMSVTAATFLLSLGFLVGSFSQARLTRGCCFYLSVFVCDMVLAVLQVSLSTAGTCKLSGRSAALAHGRAASLLSPQVIMDIIFVIGVNPMSQSSQSALYNPVLMMCQSIGSQPSLSGSLGAGFPAGFPMYNRYLSHYCYMDPEEVRPFFPSPVQLWRFTH